MLIVTFSQGRAVNWHINEPFPLPRIGETTKEVYVDMEEKEYIERKFSNLPIVPSKSRVVYKGVLAQFITDNLA